ncbi:class I SAM-dependent methyltransferase [Subsaximicrobium wynnwilliamsii]|uniref:Class I SAM-dependent methyltransferase n=1 Tax=Subsaximicrobium wynnwilliamsii TaxID=291179 RepID=A0A5C6ZLE4_9FLAO|nr:class I SAM-dependent methyltransferase [Subsaximicrobium wynnwilliamsii]TXD85051.1 class I SAM-dependent methyltransferase [Subsaximicrobium wynnwilliamsii]TXD91094.1 class I SAM-dependent methyltransferase [Subsaximicrobium wynnwilliamsii]TXE04488.1 class I SAM-dependent methyltransferase [Subsaximicrobium wynnwilliamsii]
MNLHLLNSDIQKFIDDHLDTDVSTLLFKGSDFETVTTLEIVAQIESKLKCKNKLPTWFATEGIYYPNKLNIEQTSSETAAAYKASVLSGNRIIDLTGGFGVDSFYFSKHFNEVVHCEMDAELSKIASHNFTQLKTRNIETQVGDAMALLKTRDQKWDWIYVDPSRRHDSKGKVFFLSDCLPNVPEHLEVLFRFSNHIAIKTSPLLDLKAGINALNHVKTIHIVAINNEVKELLWLLEKGHQDRIAIHSINIGKNGTETFEFYLEDEGENESTFSQPLAYLYEPNAALLKSGAYKTLSKKLEIHKLHQHSHLYTSDQILNFPGRRFKIEKLLDFNKKALKKEAFQKANISTRNFPESVEQLRKKFKISDGGEQYLFFTTTMEDQKIVVVCSKIDA